MNSSRGSTPKIDNERGGMEEEGAGAFPLEPSGAGEVARRARLSGGGDEVRVCILEVDHRRVAH